MTEAVACYRRAIGLDPDYGMAHSNLARTLNDQGLFEAGLESSKRAVALIPDFLGAQVNCAAALTGLERFAEAEAQLRRAVDLVPDKAEAHRDLGEILAKLGRLDEAFASYRRALTIKPDYSVAHVNLGIALTSLGELDDAVASCHRALALDPDYVLAYRSLGDVLLRQGKVSEAIACLGHAVSFKPDDSDALTAWFQVRQHICDWSSYREDEARVRSTVGSQPSLGATARLLPLSTTPEELLDRALRVAAKMAVPESAVLPRPQPRPGDRIRLGYLSADFRPHPVAFLIAELIEFHDRRDFEVIGYSYGPDAGSGIRSRLTSAFDRFVDISDMRHRQAAERIHADAVNILIDLTGSTGFCRPAILAHRPAPIQFNYLGYPGTMGADFLDYIVDPFLVPMDQQPFYTERLVHLPNCYQPSDTRRKIAEPAPSRAECGLPEAGFVFCCFNNSYKITPTLFGIWMRLLNAVPGSVLCLVEANAFVKGNLRRESISRGVAAERLVFAQPAPMPEYLARLGLADLFLDTLPYNAGATANDALWAGLPVLTCSGATYVGRMAGALLTAARLPELITTSLEAYEALALWLATEPGLLAGLRERLARNRATMPLFAIARFTRDLEAAYRQMWETWKAGLPPVAFAVSPSADN